MTTLYGIKNCDTVKKARRWLDDHDVDYLFHDFRADGIDEEQLARWAKQLGWESLLNRRGTTWRALPETRRTKVDDAHSAVSIMLAHPALIKRPVLEINGTVQVGFKPEQYAALLN
jgi:arsenate reductase